jgi:hypothetical protein
MLVGSGTRLPELPDMGVSLLDCFEGSPGMREWLQSGGSQSQVVRGALKATIRADHEAVTQLVIHPHADQLRLDELASEIRFSPRAFEAVSWREFPSGFSVRWSETPEFSVAVHLPPSVNWTLEELRFLPHHAPLNEFGYLYVGMYILGNYARYFPDRWIVDVEQGAPIALAAEEFLALADWRAPLLTLSELSQSYFVVQR